MPSVVPTIVRVSVILLAVAGTAGQVAYLDVLWWHTLGLTGSVGNVSSATIILLTAHAIVSVVCASLSVMLVLNEGPRARAAQALGGAFAAWSYLMAYSGATILFRPDPGVGRDIFEAHFLFIEVVGLAALLRFTAVFPRPLEGEDLQPMLTLPAILLPFHKAAMFMRRPSGPWVAGFGVLVSIWSITILSGGSLSDAGLSRLMDLIRFCAAGIAVMNLHRAWDVATEGDRDALTWLMASLALLLGALALLIGGNMLGAVTGFPEPAVAWRPIVLDIGLIGFLLGLAMAAQYRGPLDPAVMTKRITTIAAVGTGGLFLAAGLEAFLTGEITGRLSLRSGIGTAVAFAVVLSTYRGLARLIDRLIAV